jgi:Zn-finger protein
VYLYSCVKCHLRNNTSNTNTVIQESQAEMRVQTEEIERKQDEMKVKHKFLVAYGFAW